MSETAPAPGKVIVVTGASTGMGRGIAVAAARAGMRAVLGDITETARGGNFDERPELTTQALIEADGGEAIFVPCDVGKPDDANRLIAAAVERFGRLDVLVNNAGFGVYGSVEKTPLSAFRDNMETNFFGVIRCTQAALPLLRAAVKSTRARWGASIIMVSSIVGRRTIPGMSAYCASKFALEALSETLRVELSDERIAVSVINPSVTQTEFVEAAKGERPGNFLSPNGGMTSEAVAHTILQAAKRPRRNRYLSAAGKAGVVLQWASPKLFDAILLRTWRKASGK